MHVGVFEVFWEYFFGELSGVFDNESGSVGNPVDDLLELLFLNYCIKFTSNMS